MREPVGEVETSSPPGWLGSCPKREGTLHASASAV